MDNFLKDLVELLMPHPGLFCIRADMKYRYSSGLQTNKCKRDMI